MEAAAGTRSELIPLARQHFARNARDKREPTLPPDGNRGPRRAWSGIVRLNGHCSAEVWLSLALIAVWALPAAAGQSERPQQVLEAIGITPQLDAEVPQEATFVDHRGQRVEFGKLLGEHPVVLCLVYFRCPMLCSMTADGLVQSVRELSGDVGEEFDVVMVSFDPREGPKQAAAARATALQRYGRSGAGRGWHALTGEQADIEALTDAVGFRYRWDESLGQYAHAAGLVIVTPAGRVSGYLNGVQFPPPELARAIRAADRGDVASTVPQNFLKCYLYDPATGEFGLASL